MIYLQHLSSIKVIFDYILMGTLMTSLMTHDWTNKNLKTVF